MTAVHDELTRVIAALPAEQARQVLDFARSLPTPANGEVEYGDWTDEDLRELTAESMKRFDIEHPGDEGYDDLVPR